MNIGTRTFVAIIAGVFVFGCTSTVPHSGDRRFPVEHRSGAGENVFETESLRVDELDFGRPAAGKTTFRAQVTNKQSTPARFALDLRTDPGLWLRGAWQTQYVFDLAPSEVREIRAPYEFIRVSPEAKLRVRFGTATRRESGMRLDSILFEKWYAVAADNAAVPDPRQRFDHLSTEHFDVYAWTNSLAARQASRNAAEREEALTTIADLLAVSPPKRIRLVLYPDSATKAEQMGHVGAGWASGNTIVEIYNRDVQLNPYHELAHVIAGKLGHPPALLNEGFATYVSERLGSDALEDLGWPGRPVDDVACELASEEKLVPLDELFARSEIGSEASRPQVSYPQAASVVKYLIETYGLDPFRRAYRSLESPNGHQTVVSNERAFRDIYGLGIVELEQNWLDHLSAVCSSERW